MIIHSIIKTNLILNQYLQYSSKANNGSKNNIMYDNDNQNNLFNLKDRHIIII
jgi:hypothetical protein